MLSRTHRFHGYGSLKPVYSRGSTVRSSLINVKYTNRGAQKPYRVAVVVSKKVNKSAVTRNRIRRRVFEIVRRNNTLVQAGSDIVLTVFSDQVAELEAGKLETVVIDLLQKIASQQQASVQTPVEHGIVKPDKSKKEEA